MQIELITRNARLGKFDLLKKIDLKFVPRPEDIYYHEETGSFYKVKFLYFSDDKIIAEIILITLNAIMTKELKEMF